MSICRTGFVFDERFLAHDTGVETVVEMRSVSFQVSPVPHPSSRFIIQRTKEFFDGAGLTQRMQPISARAATEDERAVYHTRAYIAGMRAYGLGGPSSGPWGDIDAQPWLLRGCALCRRWCDERGGCYYARTGTQCLCLGTPGLSSCNEQ